MKGKAGKASVFPGFCKIEDGGSTSGSGSPGSSSVFWIDGSVRCARAARYGETHLHPGLAAATGVRRLYSRHPDGPPSPPAGPRECDPLAPAARPHRQPLRGRSTNA